MAGPRGFLVVRLRARWDGDLLAAVSDVEPGLISHYLRAGLRLVLLGGHGVRGVPLVARPTMVAGAGKANVVGKVDPVRPEDLDDLVGVWGTVSTR